MKGAIGPFRTLLKVNIEDYEKPVELRNFTIEQIPIQQQHDLFGLEMFQLDEDKNVRGWKPKVLHGRKTPKYLDSYSTDELDELIGSEYYIYSQDSDEIPILIEAFRLYKLGYIVATYSESLSMEFAQFHHPRFMKVPRAGLLKIQVKELEHIEDLFFELKELKNKKVQLNLERFKDSPNHYYHSFINLVGILESLLTGNNNGELKFRFALNVNYVLKKSIHSVTSIDFNKLKKLYDIRSGLVHTGESKKFSEENYLLLRQITQEILVWFVFHPDYEVESEILKELFPPNLSER